MIGAEGAEAVQKLLIGTEDPQKDIPEFADSNSIQLPSLPPALRLLDLQVG